MDWDKEMERALEADGEKLRQLTGEDHGPHSLIMIPCRECGSEGRIYRNGTVYEPGCAHPHSGEVDCGPCPACEGTGREIIETEPVTEDERRMPLRCSLCGDERSEGSCAVGGCPLGLDA